VVLHSALGLLALLLAAACAFGGVLVVQQHRDDERDAAAQQTYADVLSAARSEVEAIVNIDFRSAAQDIDAVAAGATGELARRYDSSAPRVLAALRRNRSVSVGHVLWAGVSDLRADRATVIAATRGTVANVRTGRREVPRFFRLRLELVRVAGEWRTADLEFVRS
jgi:Mce-associated membrane protein